MRRKVTYNLANSVTIGEDQTEKYPIPEVNEIDINLSQLQRNFSIIRNLVKPDIKIMAVLKGDAYGHGMVPIAYELEHCKCDTFGVVRLIEAFSLRKAGIKIPIILLAPIIPLQASWITINDITPMVDNEEIVEALDESASECNKIVNIHVKINTGLNRYGIEPKEAVNFIKKIYNKYPNVKVEGIYTHFQNAEFDENFTIKQIECFNEVLNRLEKENLRPKIAHAAGSAGILMYPQSHYDMVRCGIILYGLEHKEGEKDLPDGVKPLVTLKGRILKIKTIKAGETGGYGDRFIAKKDTKVAIIGLGYGDGISRGWKEVLIADQRVPVVNYFMDGIMVDISNLKGKIKEFDEAVIIGSQGAENISWEEASKYVSSYADEQIQRITERVPKHYFYE
ncbi:alanine racemase [Clostridium sp. CX1]|uniref:alanine racemase n=1 Tax=Clostridium sp. CX1 TaxID=2978346 RepID=UPI0021C1C974|nr:alanine racemase [Clostridium sp. CX1]MCT8978810.1 alanine racemase [Clostridium sp. CX1]